VGETWLDSAINWVSPAWGATRQMHRARAATFASYNGSVSTRTSTAWAPSTQPASIFGLHSAELTRMRDRARSLERNNAIADGMLTRAVENVVGEGFQLQVTTADPQWNQLAEALLSDWFDVADITGLTWLEHQRLVFRSHLRDGDVGSILIGNQDANYARLQPVEGDQIASPLGTGGVNSGRMVDGVQIDSTGRPQKFFINNFDANGKRDHREIGAIDFVYFPRLKRLSQVRGEPCFSQTFTLFDQIDGWVEATLVAARMAACFGLVITKNQPNQFLKNLKTGENNAGEQQRQINFEPGMMPVFENGEKVETVSPAQPQQSFPDNLVAMLRLAGLSLGMPLELVLLDYSRTNFSSARASMLQAYRSFKTMQRLFIDRYLRRIYRWRISKLIKAGKLPARDDAFNHRWIAQPWPFLDPIKEAQALQLNIDMGLETLGSTLMAHGRDFQTWVTTRKAELDAMKSAGIPLVHHSASIPYNDPAAAAGAATAAADAAVSAADAMTVDEADDEDDEIPILTTGN
jgi:lambda family phage portal protein